MSSYSVSAVFTAVDKFTKPLQRMTASTQTFSQVADARISQADRAFRKLTPSLSSAGKELLAFASAGAVLFELSNQFRKIQDFETGLVGVGKTADISGKELQDFGQAVIGVSNRLKSISTDKLLEVAQSAGQLGVKGSDNILKFAETMVLLEKSSDVVGDEGAKAIARILNITGEGVGVVDKFAASLVALGNNSAASEGEILAMANEVGRATSSFRLASSEVLGISAALTSLGSKPEAAGTAVGKFFAELEGAVNKGGKQMDAFSKVMGLSSDEISSLFATNKTKLFTLFAKGIEGVQKRGGSLVATFEELGLTGERTLKGLGPMAANADLVAKSLGMASEEFEKNTALQIESQKALNTVNSAVQAVRISFDNLITSTFNSNDGFSVLKELLFFVADNMNTLITIVGVYVGAMVAFKAVTSAARVALIAYNIVQGVTTALQGGSALAFKAGTVAYYAYRAAVIASTAAQWALNVALSANPIGIIIAALVALAALIYTGIKNWDTWGAALLGALGPLGFLVNMIMMFRENWDMITKAFEDGGIKKGIAAIGLTLFQGLIKPLQQLLGLIAKIPGVGGLAQSGLDFLNNQISGLEKELDSIGEPTEEPINTHQDVAERVERSITQQNQRIDLSINDGTSGGVDLSSSGDSIVTPTVNRTFGQ